MNERTRLIMKIYHSHIIRKGWCWLCVRGELKTGTDCYILTLSSSDYSSTSFAFWLGCSTVDHWGSKPSVWHLVPNCHWNWTDSSRLWHLVIFLFDIHLLPVGVGICTEFNHVHRSRYLRYLRPDAPVSLFFRFFTQVHLLIDGSVEGQYVTIYTNL